MRRFFTTGTWMKLFLSFVVLLSILTLSQAQDSRLALVIGNAAYQYGGKLKNPVNDANLMARTLRELGFVVITKTNADLDDMQEGFKQFVSQLDRYDVALFFYAGHGLQVDGENYLIPVDAKLEDKLSVEFEAFKVASVNKYFSYRGDKMNIIILDACRNNPYRAWMRGGGQGFRAIEEQGAGTIIAFATREGETASDGTGGNGLYTRCLVNQMRTTQNITEVFQNTRVCVLEESKQQQIPQEWNMLTGNFYFTQIDGSVTKRDENLSEAKSIAYDEFKVAKRGSFIDTRDNQTYKWVKIGDQIWMAESLKYHPETESWCYNDKDINCQIYGRMYNWETSRKVCPNGWHLPTKAEFITLLTFVGGTDVVNDRGMLKGGSILAYHNLVKGGTSGFDDLLAGKRVKEGDYRYLSFRSNFWTYDEERNESAWLFTTDDASLKDKIPRITYGRKHCGQYVRCIKD
ncbi:FISUMP domain-containing protein [Bacteroidota bacterium]